MEVCKLDRVYSINGEIVIDVSTLFQDDSFS